MHNQRFMNFSLYIFSQLFFYWFWKWLFLFYFLQFLYALSYTYQLGLIMGIFFTVSSFSWSQDSTIGEGDVFFSAKIVRSRYNEYFNAAWLIFSFGWCITAFLDQGKINATLNVWAWPGRIHGLRLISTVDLV